MTAVLQLFVFLAAAVSFAAYALWKDKREHAQRREDQAQQSIYFPESGSSNVPEDGHDHRGAAMSRLP